ncbi:MAG: ATP-binding protein [Planctomycetaceae bacterium]|nr:ATP-binding protein [Planctomycetaceae bacterium]
MLRRWWRSLGFYWQVYLVMVISFGGIITLVEGVAEPLVLTLLEERFQMDMETSEIILWIVSVLIPTLVLGFIITHMVVRKMTTMVKLAKRLSSGDLAARIHVTGNEKDVFRQLAEVFNEMADSLERLLSHEKRLIADISHELRSPLTRMSLATALLPSKRKPEEFEAMVKVLDDEINQMSALVGTLLQQGRDRLKNRQEYSRIVLADFIQEIADASDCGAAGEGTIINIDCTPNILVLGHAVGLRIIIQNILANALFYSSPKSHVDITIVQDGDRVVITVRDRGTGVPDHHLHDIFKPFFRVDESRARTSGGAGLGLALAQDAAVAMGGTIEARNATPGLEVVVSLPIALPDRNGRDSS